MRDETVEKPTMDEAAEKFPTRPRVGKDAMNVPTHKIKAHKQR